MQSNKPIMRYIADLHIHSKYSRACSKRLELETIAAWAQIKGINVISCGDFTHPRWFAVIEKKLVETAPGLYSLKNEYHSAVHAERRKNGISSYAKATEDKADADRALPSFILTTEISCIYSKAGSVRRVHVLIFAPSLDAVRRINAALAMLGKLASDGRPILGLDAKELLKIISNISPDCYMVPAHIWTPWFAVFGSKSGFNSLEECFDELTPHIFAAETGLSSDPRMNWHCSIVNPVTLISNSDAHSLEKLGREANVFEGTDISYPLIRDALKNACHPDPNNVIPASSVIPAKAGIQKHLGSQKPSGYEANRSGHSTEQSIPLRLSYTVEFFPEEGRYHLDGHRDCGVSLNPAQTKKFKGLCPTCSKPLTIGVLHRVMELADQDPREQERKKIGFKNIIPLQELIGQALQQGVNTKRVGELYAKVINRFGSEFAFLLDASVEEMQQHIPRELVSALRNMRTGAVEIIPGYDGVYGVINAVKPSARRQSALM